MSKMSMVLIPQIVSVRKHSVDKKGLSTCLRVHRNLPNRQIAAALNVPITEVEHWFRTDSSQSIPRAELWDDIKRLLGITTNEFDAQITDYEVRFGNFEKSERCYEPNGLSPTLTTFDGGGIKVIIQTNKQGDMKCETNN